MMKIYKDNFQNKAIIEKTNILPYYGSPIKEPAYILSLYACYDNDFLYFRSVYPTLQDAKNKLKEFSCDTFKEVCSYE